MIAVTMATAGHHIGEAGSIVVAVLKEEEGGIKVLQRPFLLI